MDSDGSVDSSFEWPWSRRTFASSEFVTTIHASTSPQALVDGPSKEWHRGPAAALIDAPSTRVLGPRAAKALTWDDNEWAYARRVVALAARIGAEWTATKREIDRHRLRTDRMSGQVLSLFWSGCSVIPERPLSGARCVAAEGGER